MSDEPRYDPRSFPPFNKNAVCPKCMGTTFKNVFHEDGWRYVDCMDIDWSVYKDQTARAHLHRSCACGFAWYEWPANKLILVGGWELVEKVRREPDRFALILENIESS